MVHDEIYLGFSILTLRRARNLFLRKNLYKIHWAEFLNHYSLITMTKSLSLGFPGRCIAAACTFPVRFYSEADAKISEICHDHLQTLPYDLALSSSDDSRNLCKLQPRTNRPADSRK
jgi:hypothetical protein